MDLCVDESMPVWITAMSTLQMNIKGTSVSPMKVEQITLSGLEILYELSSLKLL